MNGNRPLDEVNREVYENISVARHYGRLDSLFPGEETAFRQVSERCRNRSIVDLGVGAGRTTPYLLSLSQDYLGIDYSAEMIARARESFPNVRFEVGDARNLGALSDHQFSLAVFSFNGIDYVCHADRLLILREISRILTEDGILIFSTHNAAFDRRKSQSICKRMLGRPKDYVCNAFNNFRWRSLIRNSPYVRAIRSFDKRHVLLTYFISNEEQIAQLRTAGFECEKVIAEDGRFVEQETDRTSAWLYYVATKKPPIYDVTRKTSARVGA